METDSVSVPMYPNHCCRHHCLCKSNPHRKDTCCCAIIGLTPKAVSALIQYLECEMAIASQNSSVAANAIKEAAAWARFAAFEEVRNTLRDHHLDAVFNVQDYSY